MRRHRTSDWNVWYGTFGKTDYAKQMGHFVIVSSLFDLFVVLPFKLFVILPLQLMAYYLDGRIYAHNQRVKEQERVYSRVAKHIEKIETLLSEINSSTTTKARRKSSSRKVLELLQQIDQLGHKEGINNFEDLKKYLQIVIRASDAIEYLEKADKHLFLGESKQEQRSLLQAIYHLKKNRITKREFKILQITSALTGKVWAIEYLKKRLLDTGYKAPQPKTR